MQTSIFVESVCIVSYFVSIPRGFKMATSRNSFTSYHSASIAADGEHQHVVQESCSLTVKAFFNIALTHIKGINVAN